MKLLQFREEIQEALAGDIRQGQQLESTGDVMIRKLPRSYKVLWTPTCDVYRPD